MVIFLGPFSTIEYYAQRYASIQWKKRRYAISSVVSCSVSWSTDLLLWVIALQFISTVLASLTGNSVPLYLAFYYHFTGVKLTYYEWSGVAVAVTGLVIASWKGLLSDQNTSTTGM